MKQRCVISAKRLQMPSHGLILSVSVFRVPKSQKSLKELSAVLRLLGLVMRRIIQVSKSFTLFMTDALKRALRYSLNVICSTLSSIMTNMKNLMLAVQRFSISKAEKLKSMRVLLLSSRQADTAVSMTNTRPTLQALLEMVSLRRYVRERG